MVVFHQSLCRCSQPESVPYVGTLSVFDPPHIHRPTLPRHMSRTASGFWTGEDVAQQFETMTKWTAASTIPTWSELPWVVPVEIDLWVEGEDFVGSGVLTITQATPTSPLHATSGASICGSTMATKTPYRIGKGVGSYWNASTSSAILPSADYRSRTVSSQASQPSRRPQESLVVFTGGVSRHKLTTASVAILTVCLQLVAFSEY